MANAPLLICVGGMSGSGKTSLAEALSKSIPNAVHLDSDRTRKEIFGVSETTRLPAEAYSSEATQRLITEMARRTKEAVAGGKTVIISATFLSSRNREEQKLLASACGAQLVGIWLEADLKVLFDRVAKRVDNPSDAGVDIVEMQVKRNSPPPADWPVIDATQSREDVAAAALEIIEAAQKAAPKRYRFCPPSMKNGWPGGFGK